MYLSLEDVFHTKTALRRGALRTFVIWTTHVTKTTGNLKPPNEDEDLGLLGIIIIVCVLLETH